MQYTHAVLQLETLYQSRETENTVKELIDEVRGMSELLQLDSESPAHSSSRSSSSAAVAALASGIPHEVRLKLAKRMRREQLRRYHEREQQETGYTGDSASIEQYGDTSQKRRNSSRVIAFQAKDMLMDAAQNSDTEEVRRMLYENLASPNTASEATGSSLLHLCALNNDLPSVKFLLEHGAEVNIQDYDLWTPLHVAAACGHTGVAEILLEYEADCTLLDVDGNFAYDSAESDELKELLLKHMSFKGIYEQDLSSLRSRKAKAMLAAVKDCVTHNRNLNLLNKNGVALLHIASANGYYRIAKLLLDGGAKVDVLDDLGYTPLHVAAKFNQLKLVKLLLKRSATPIVRSAQLELPVDLSDLEEITELLTQAGGEYKATKLPEVFSPNEALLLPSPLSPVTIPLSPPSPSPGHDSGVDTNDPLLTPNQIQSVNINFNEFDLARTASKILNRSIPVSKLEVLFEAETLAERDKFDEGTDVSTQAPALRRLGGKILKKRHSEKLLLPDPGATDNLATLSDLTEDILVRFLQERYQRDQIYTLVGEILVAVNPFKTLPFYSNLASEQYSNSSINSTLPPHIFAVADQVYNDMLAEKKPQCCVISGESGAGKTETCKLLTQHLLYVAASSLEGELSIKTEQVSPVLEAFGNAKTVMNNNSSRFGKYLELLFSDEGAILGGCFKEYLLEKSRVIVQGYNERNFHIFYQMFAGLSDDQKEMLKLDNPAAHRCLNGSGEPLNEIITPEMGKSFAEVCDSLQAIGFSEQDQESLLRCLASVLHICDVCFTTADEGSTVSNLSQVELVAELLQVDSKELSACFIQEATITRGEEIIRHRSVALANECRDALAKALYGKMFGWIVNSINHHLQPEDIESTHPLRVGILDIFGFENFEKNGFEQMCINIANEQLQHFFNEHIFKWELEECAREGIVTESICFHSNRPVVELFLGKTTGLLALINEESRFPRATDRTLAAKMHRVHHRGQEVTSNDDDNNRVVYKAPPDKGAKFGVNHYAGYVEYDLSGFLDKNRDTLPPSVQMLMKTSGNLLIREIFGAKLTKTGSVAPSMRQRMSRKAESPFSHYNRKTSKRLSRTMARRKAHRNPAAHGRKFETGKRIPPTVSNHFRNSLAELMEKMNSSKPHFIRCIKPNRDKVPDSLISDYVQKQLRYTGVMETARIRQCGFPTRLTFSDFCKRYWILREFYAPQLASHEPLPVETVARQILEHVGIAGWECGRTKVMLKFNHTTELERHTRRVITKTIIIQRCFRDWLARKMMQELVKVKQNQANIVKHLLGSAISQGLTNFRELERLNNEDTITVINMEGMRHTPMRNDYKSGHSYGYPTSQGSQNDTVYAKVTNVNNNSHIPTDGTVPPAKVPVYRIRSLPQSGGDDTIMITTPTAELPTGSLEVQQPSRSPRSPRPYSRQRAPLPPVPPDEDVNSVYSLAQAVPLTQPLSSIQHSLRQNAPLPPPPSTIKVSPAHIKTERIITNRDSASQLDQTVNFEAEGNRYQSSNYSQLEYQDEDEEVYDDAFSKIAPSGENWQQAASHPSRPSFTRGGTLQPPSSPETRKNSPLPPLPPPSSMDSPDTNKQTMFTKHVDSGTAACTNRVAPKQQLLTSVPVQPSKQSLEANKLSVSPRPRRSKSRSPSPPAPTVPCRSPGTKRRSTPSPPPPQDLEKIQSSHSELPGSTSHYSSHRPLTSSSSAKSYSTSQPPSSVHGNNCSEEAPPKPPPRKTSAPTELNHPTLDEESMNDAPNMPPVPPRKTSGGKPIMDPGAPPLPSRRIIENSESSAPTQPVHKTSDTSEPIPPPLPSREVIKEQSGSQAKKLSRRNATRTKSNDSLTSLPEEEESGMSFTSLGEGIFTRGAMQRRLKGLLRAPNKNRPMSNQFSSQPAKPKVKLGKRLSDPSCQAESGKNHIPIHKMPLPPIPVQIRTSASAPQMVHEEDVPQDVYEDLDKACELVNQELDVPQFDYEDLDMQTDKPQDHYEDIDMDTDKPQDHYEDIDYDMEDKPQEVYEDINDEAAQRVSFVINGAHIPQDYTTPIARRSVAYREEDEPQDYSPPIRRGGALHTDDDEEPQEYTPPIRRGGAHSEVDEPQDYSPPIRRSRVCADDDEPQEYASPVVKKSVVSKQQDNQSMPAPPLPPRYASRQPHNHRRRPPVTVTPSVSPASTKDQQHQASSSSLGQQTTRLSPPPPVSPSTKSRFRSRSPVPPLMNRSHPEAPPPSRQAPTNVGVPAPPPAPSIGGAPPPPPPPAVEHKAPPPVSHSSRAADVSQQTDDDPPSDLLNGIMNVQLKKASERTPPQKPPPPASSGSSTASLFAEMQSLQLRKTKRPTTGTKPSQVDGTSSSGPKVPFHAVLRPTQSVGQSPRPAPRTKSPPVRPKPSKLPPPALKPKPAHLLSPKRSAAAPSPLHSNDHVMLKSHNRLGVPATN